VRAALCLDGKLGRRRGQLNSLGGLIYLQDSQSAQKFLVDTGAAVSVLPHRSSIPPSGPSLSGADGKPIASWGTVRKKLCFGLQTFLCSFILAAVSKPILGIDFLAAHRLLVDPYSRQVLHAATLKPIGAAVAAAATFPSRFVAALSLIIPPVRDLLSAFPSIVGDGSGTPRPKHGIKHHVETSGRPVFAKARRLDPAKHRLAEKEFLALEKAGIVRRSNSPWSSPLHMVPKPDGSWRPCGDYRRLNLATKRDRYPLPSLLDFSANLHGCKFFSCVDLVKGYHQIPMSWADIAKTAIVTPFGLFEYLFMPFGLLNAAQSFQRLMDRLFGHLPFLFTYLDDHLIASRTLEEHLDHLRQFFQILQDNGLVINPAKCVFAASSLKFLGHMVSEAGVIPLPRHVEAVRDFPPPTDVKGLQRFLGLVNFYRRFLPAIAKTLRPLTDLLKGSPKLLAWSDEAATAFEAAKAALVAAVPLSHPSPLAKLSLSVDASDSHVGAVLQQRSGQSWEPLAFFSKKLDPAQVRYSTFDRELLAAYSAVRHFRFLLEGREFHILTDHKPLVSSMLRVSPPWSARQQRHLSYIAEFTSDLRHTPGSSNVVADALSRPAPHQISPPQLVPKSPVAACPPTARPSTPSQLRLPSRPVVLFAGLSGPLPPTQEVSACSEHSLAAVATAQPIDFAALALAQPSCPSVTAMQSSDSLQIVSRDVSGVPLLGDVSTGVFRPLVPVQFRDVAFHSLHGINHPGVRASRRLLCRSFCWPHMGREVTVMARSCLQCQRSKISRHVHLQPEVIPVPCRRFSHLHVDLVGPLPSSAGFTYLFTIVDRTTRWPEAIPLSSISAADCAAALFSGWVQRFGLPSIITSDRGPQFTSGLWAALCSLLSITHVPTTAYHPQANGLVERFHRRLKDALRARAAGADWHAHLPWVMLGIRSACSEEADFSPAEAVFAAQPVLPGQFLLSPESPSPSFLSDLQNVLAGRAPRPTSHHSSSTSPKPLELPEELLLTRFVLVRRDAVQPPLSPLYDGPYLVLERSVRFFKLQIGDRTDTVSTLRLKACRTPPDAQAALPPRRGRPRSSVPPSTSTPTAHVPGSRKKRVTFSSPLSVTIQPKQISSKISSPPISSNLPQLLHPSDRPRRIVRAPLRYSS